VGTINFILKSGLRNTFGMDKATATPHPFRTMKSHRGKHNQTDMGAIAIIFIPINQSCEVWL